MTMTSTQRSMRFIHILVLLATWFFCLPALLHAVSICNGDTDTTATPSLTWFSGRRIVHAPQADLFQPRTGLLKYFDSEGLRIEVGYGIEPLHYRIDSTRELAVGGSFYAFGQIESVGPLILQLLAADAFFGGYVAYRQQLSERSSWLGQVILGHISSHFADGRWDYTRGIWRDSLLPFGSSRDFLTLWGEYQYGAWRGYASSRYAFQIRPRLNRWQWQVGAEVAPENAFARHITPYCSVDLKYMNPQGAFLPTLVVQSGVKFGPWRGQGINVYLLGYTGNNFYGLLFNERIQFGAIGFKLDL